MLSYHRISDLKIGSKGFNLRSIILEISKPQNTKEGHVVRSCRISDESGSVNLSVWNEVGDLLRPGDIIDIKNGYVQLFKGSITVYTGKVGIIEKIGEFCLMFSEEPNISANLEVSGVSLDKNDARGLMYSRDPRAPKHTFYNARMQGDHQSPGSAATSPVASASIPYYQNSSARPPNRDPRLVN